MQGNCSFFHSKRRLILREKKKKKNPEKTSVKNSSRQPTAVITTSMTATTTTKKGVSLGANFPSCVASLMWFFVYSGLFFFIQSSDQASHFLRDVKSHETHLTKFGKEVGSDNEKEPRWDAKTEPKFCRFPGIPTHSFAFAVDGNFPKRHLMLSAYHPRFPSFPIVTHRRNETGCSDENRPRRRCKRMKRTIKEDHSNVVNITNHEEYLNEFSSIRFLGIGDFSSTFELSTTVGFMCESEFFKIMALQRICSESFDPGSIEHGPIQKEVYSKNSRVRNFQRNENSRDDIGDGGDDDDDDDDDSFVDDDDDDDDDYNNNNDRNPIDDDDENSRINPSSSFFLDRSRNSTSGPSLKGSFVERKCFLKNERIFYHTINCGVDGNWENLKALPEKSTTCESRLKNNLFSFQSSKIEMPNSSSKKTNRLKHAWIENILSIFGDNSSKKECQNRKVDEPSELTGISKEGESEEKSQGVEFDDQHSEEQDTSFDFSDDPGDYNGEAEKKKDDHSSDGCREKLDFPSRNLPLFSVSKIAFVVEGAVLGNSILVFDQRSPHEKKHCFQAARFSMPSDSELVRSGQKKNKKMTYLEYQCDGLNYWSPHDIFMKLSLPGSLISDVSVYSRDVDLFLDPMLEPQFLSQSLCGLPRFPSHAENAHLEIHNGQAIGMKLTCQNKSFSPEEFVKVSCFMSSELGRWNFNDSRGLCSHSKMTTMPQILDGLPEDDETLSFSQENSSSSSSSSEEEEEEEEEEEDRPHGRIISDEKKRKFCLREFSKLGNATETALRNCISNQPPWLSSSAIRATFFFSSSSSPLPFNFSSEFLGQFVSIGVFCFLFCFQLFFLLVFSARSC